MIELTDLDIMFATTCCAKASVSFGGVTLEPFGVRPHVSIIGRASEQTAPVVIHVPVVLIRNRFDETLVAAVKVMSQIAQHRLGLAPNAPSDYTSPVIVESML